MGIWGHRSHNCQLTTRELACYPRRTTLDEALQDHDQHDRGPTGREPTSGDHQEAEVLPPRTDPNRKKSTQHTRAVSSTTPPLRQAVDPHWPLTPFRETHHSSQAR